MTWMGESSIGECFFLASISTSCSTIIICNILYIKCNILCIKCSTRSPWQSPCLSNILNMLCKIYWIYHVKYIEYIHLSCSSSVCISCCLPLTRSRRAECWVWGLIFRCASIAWFQVVSQWVLYLFRIAHLRVFQSCLYLYLYLYSYFRPIQQSQVFCLKINCVIGPDSLSFDFIDPRGNTIQQWYHCTFLDGVCVFSKYCLEWVRESCIFSHRKDRGPLSLFISSSPN